MICCSLDSFPSLIDIVFMFKSRQYHNTVDHDTHQDFLVNFLRRTENSR